MAFIIYVTHIYVSYSLLRAPRSRPLHPVASGAMPIDDADWPRADQWLSPGDPDDGCDISVYGVPTSAGSVTGSDTHLAPAALRAALDRFSTFNSVEDIDVRDVTAIDGGDWDLADFELEETPDRIRELVRDSALGTTAAVFWGGDNSITRPLMQGTSSEWSRVFGLLTIGAHHDVRSLDNGPTNNTTVRGLIEAGLSGERIAQVGIQPFANSRADRDYAEHNGVSTRTTRDIEKRGVEEVVLKELHHISGRSDWIYVNFNMDVLDVAFAPGCPRARPGGFSPRELSHAAFVAGKHPKVIVADFVEVDPNQDPSGITVLAMANAFLSFAAGVAARPLAT